MFCVVYLLSVSEGKTEGGVDKAGGVDGETSSGGEPGSHFTSNSIISIMFPFVHPSTSNILIEVVLSHLNEVAESTRQLKEFEIVMKGKLLGNGFEKEWEVIQSGHNQEHQKSDESIRDEQRTGSGVANRISKIKPRQCGIAGWLAYPALDKAEPVPIIRPVPIAPPMAIIVTCRDRRPR